MGFYNGYDGTWVIKRYGKGYRDVHERMNNGKVIMYNSYKDNNTNKQIKSKIICIVKEGELTEERLWENGKMTYSAKWGEYEKALKDGKIVSLMRYHGTARGKHGLCVRTDFKLEGYEGRCYTLFSRGKLMRQQFVYTNGRTAYFMKWTDTEVMAKHPNGNSLFSIKVNSLYTKGNEQGEPFIYHRHHSAGEQNYSADGIYCEYIYWDKRGRIKTQGKYEHNQRIGEWIDNYKRYFYLSGLAVPKKLYDAKPEEINPHEVLGIKNAQVRAMMLKKVGVDRLVKECKGKVIDRYQKYELYDFPVKNEKAEGYEPEPDKVIRVLKVVCPSTQAEYFLRVPATDDFNTCLKARTGTFTHFEPKAKHIEFANET